MYKTKNKTLKNSKISTTSRDSSKKKELSSSRNKTVNKRYETKSLGIVKHCEGL